MFFAPKFDASKDLTDLSGKVVVISGANTGIGYHTAKILARRGAKVYVGSRSKEKGETAIAQLRKEDIGSGQVEYLPCDISTPALARQAAEVFLSKETRLDILVNNAAMLIDGSSIATQDGITEMIMTNHIGVAQLTMSLLPLLLKTSELPDSDVRIVTVGSNGHRASPARNPKLDFSTLDAFKDLHEKDNFATFSRYTISKLCNTLFTNALQRQPKVALSNIICISLHPGFVNTSISTKLPWPRLASAILSLVAINPEAGAYTSCFAAASPIVRQHPDQYKGAYLEPYGKIVPPSTHAQNTKMQDALWRTTEEYLKGTRLLQLLWDLVEKAYAHSEKEEGRQLEVFRFQEVV